MTDDLNHQAGDDPLDAPHDETVDDRIRAGLEALIGEAPEPPPAAGLIAAPVVPLYANRRRWAWAGAAAVLVVIVGALVVANHDPATRHLRAAEATSTSTSTSSTPAAVVDRSLYGTRWLLVAGEKDGQELEVPPPDRPASVTFDDHFNCPGNAGNCSPPSGAAYFYSTGCNSGGGSMRVEGDRIYPSGNGGETLVGCSLEVRPFEGGDRSKNEFWTFKIDGDTLVLQAPDGRLQTYRASDDTLPKVQGTVLAEDHEGTVNYRVSWRAVDEKHYTMAFERGSSGRNDAAGIGGDANRPTVQVKKAHIYDRDLIYGMVPAASTKVTYVSSKTDPIDIPLRKMDGGPFKGMASMVPPGDQKWTVIATDASGAEVGRMTTDYTGTTIDPFGLPEGQEVARGNHKYGQYRLSWDLTSTGGTLTLDRAQATSVLPPVSVEDDPTRPGDVEADVGHLSVQNIIFGLAPGEGVRATVDRHVGNEGPFALRLIPLPGTTRKAFHGVYSWTSDTFDVTVYDSDGGIVGTYHHQAN